MPFDHVAFQVSDLDRSVEFYEKSLGFEHLFTTTDEEHGERFAYFDLKEGKLELLELLGEHEPIVPRAPEPPYCPHLAIRVDNLEETVASLASKGIPILCGPLQTPGQVKWLYIADPDANEIEFVEWE